MLPQLGLRFTALAGLWLVGGVYILMSFVASMPSGWVFIMFSVLLRVTEGVGSAMFITSIFAQLPKLFPDLIGTMNGLLGVAGALGFTLGLPLGGILFAVGGFKLPFLTVGSFCLFILLVSFFVNKDYDISACERNLPLYKILAKLMSSLVIILLVLANSAGWASWSFFLSTLEPFLSSQFNLTEMNTGLVFLIPAAVHVVVATLVGRLTDVFGTRWFIISGYFVVGVSFFFIGPVHFISQPKLWMTATALAFFGIGSSLSLVPVFKDILTVGKLGPTGDGHYTAMEGHKNYAGVKYKDWKTSINKSLVDEKDTDAFVNVVSGITSSSVFFGDFIGYIAGGALTQIMDFPTSAMVFGTVILAEASLLLGVTVIDLCTRWQNK